MTWSNGRHNYYGKYNSRSQRRLSKMTAGLKIDKRGVSIAFKEIENEKRRAVEKTP